MTSDLPLVSLDIGGTLATSGRPGLATVLAAASPLPAARARAVMREHLHTKPQLTDEVIAAVCQALDIPPEAFPSQITPAPLRLLPGVADTLEQMSRVARLVTLSNVVCAEAGAGDIRALLGPWIHRFYRSCDIGVAKPDRRAFEHVAAAHGRTPAGMLHLGDDWLCDVIGATQAGATAVWISHGRDAPSDTVVDVIVAQDFPSAVRHVHDFATRRPS